MADETKPLAQAYQAYEQLEGRLSTALEQLVATNGFADLLATTATNALAVTRMANGRIDQAVRATRLAARRDVVDLARQLARTEDKLERLLQVVEQVQARLDEVAPLLAEKGGTEKGEVSSATGSSPRTTSGRPSGRAAVRGASSRASVSSRASRTASSGAPSSGAPASGGSGTPSAEPVAEQAAGGGEAEPASPNGTGTRSRAGAAAGTRREAT